MTTQTHFFVSGADLGQLKELAGNAPELRFSETDQTEPAGRYRFRVNGDVFYFERSDAANWASALTIWSATDSGIIPLAADGTAASPSYTFMSDTGTGLYFTTVSTRDAVGIAAGGGAIAAFTPNASADGMLIFATATAYIQTTGTNQTLHVLGNSDEVHLVGDSQGTNASGVSVGASGTTDASPIAIMNSLSTTDVVREILRLQHTDSGAGANLKGASMTFYTQTTSSTPNTNALIGQIAASWVDVSNGTRSKLTLYAGQGGAQEVAAVVFAASTVTLGSTTTGLSIGTGEGGNTAATGYTLRAPDVRTAGGAGDLAGADLTIRPGLGTGTGDVGQIIFQGAVVAAAGNNIQTTQTVAVLDNNALVAQDDMLFALGTNVDQVLLNRSTTLTANTALTGVLIGTPVTQAVAINSLLISNTTASGDLGVYVNNGGNSLEVVHADASAGTATIGHGLAGLTLKTNSSDVTLSPAGTLNFSPSYTDVGVVCTAVRSDSVAYTGAVDHSVYRFHVDNTNAITTAASGTHTIIASAVVSEPNITIGTATVSVAASLYIPNQPTEGVNNASLLFGATSSIIRVLGALDIETTNGAITFVPNTVTIWSGEKSADPTLAAATFTLFQADGVGTGDEGDVIIGADNAAGGGDKFAILFDYSAGTVSSARYKEHIKPLSDPYRILGIRATEWDVRGSGIHEQGFQAEDVYRVLGRGATPMSKVSAEWWNPEYYAMYGYQVGDRAPNQIHWGGIIGAHHEILRDLVRENQELKAEIQELRQQIAKG